MQRVRSFTKGRALAQLLEHLDVTPADPQPLRLWCARDALVLKALALAVAPRLALSSQCVHIKGHGGLKAAVRRVQQQLGGHEYVLRTDVRGFCESRPRNIPLTRMNTGFAG